MHCQKRRSVAFGAMADKFVCKGSANAQKTKNFAVVSALLAVAQTAHPTPIVTLPMLHLTTQLIVAFLSKIGSLGQLSSRQEHARSARA